jgi:hypothetical protein
MSKTNYKYRKFNLSEKSIEKLLKSIEANIPSSFYLSKKIINEEPVKGSVKLLLNSKECEKVQNGKPFTYNLSKDKISMMSKKNTKSGGILPIILPAIIAGIGALGGLASGTAAVVNAVNQRKTDVEKNEIQKEHNKELETILKEGKGLYLNSGNGLYLTKYGEGFVLHL